MLTLTCMVSRLRPRLLHAGEEGGVAEEEGVEEEAVAVEAAARQAIVTTTFASRKK